MKVTQIQTKETVFFTGVGDLGKTINDSSSQKVNKFPGLTLSIIEGVGIKISCQGRFYIAPWESLKGVIGIEDGSSAEPIQQPAPIKHKVDTSAANS